MKEFMRFPSIDQYRNAVKTVQNYMKWNDITGEFPVEVTGTVKLHGTNAGIGYSPDTGEIWAQSRNGIITQENDNAGFAEWVHDNYEKILESVNYLFPKLSGENVYLFGEWCGGNIQKDVGINGLDKMFVLFSIYIDEHLVEPYDYETIIQLRSSGVSNVYSVSEFKSWKMTIDFSKPDLWTNKLAEITNDVEAECPVAKKFGVCNGTGEGVVWTGFVDDHPFRFKVKGDKHSSSKVKKLAKVDIEKLKSIEDFVDYSVTESRLNQAISELSSTMDIDKSKTGNFIRWIANDIIKEESDTLEGNGLTWKDVASTVSKRAANWFMSNYG